MYPKRVVRHITFGPGSVRADREKEEINVILSSDSRLCGPCRGDRPRIYQKLMLPELRHSAERGCLRCKLLLTGVQKSDYLLKGSGHGCAGLKLDPSANDAPWKEEKIQIYVNPKDVDILEVEVALQAPGKTYNDQLHELEFHSGVGKVFAF